MSRWSTVLYYLQKLSDYLEGDAHLIGLKDNLPFVNEWRRLVIKYSNMPPECTAFFEGTTGDFLYFQTEVFTPKQLTATFFETALFRTLEKALSFQGFQCIQMYSFLDLYGEKSGQWRVSIYFSTSDKQMRKLQAWYAHQKVSERNEYLRILKRGIRDTDLEKEMKMQEEIKNAD